MRKGHSVIYASTQVCNDEKITHLRNIVKYGSVVFPYHYHLLVYTLETHDYSVDRRRLAYQKLVCQLDIYPAFPAAFNQSGSLCKISLQNDKMHCLYILCVQCSPWETGSYSSYHRRFLRCLFMNVISTIASSFPGSTLYMYKQFIL